MHNVLLQCAAHALVVLKTAVQTAWMGSYLGPPVLGVPRHGIPSRLVPFVRPEAAFFPVGKGASFYGACVERLGYKPVWLERCGALLRARLCFPFATLRNGSLSLLFYKTLH